MSDLTITIYRESGDSVKVPVDVDISRDERGMILNGYTVVGKRGKYPEIEKGITDDHIWDAIKDRERDARYENV